MSNAQAILAKLTAAQQLVVDLQTELDVAMAAEKQAAIPEMLEKIRALGITVDDLFPAAQRSTTAEAASEVAADGRKKVEPKYRNAETGATWTGRGKSPAWMTGKDKAQFLIAVAPESETLAAPATEAANIDQVSPADHLPCFGFKRPALDSVGARG